MEVEIEKKVKLQNKYTKSKRTEILYLYPNFFFSIHIFSNLTAQPVCASKQPKKQCHNLFPVSRDGSTSNILYKSPMCVTSESWSVS